MKRVVAIQRKLLELIYIIFKTKKVYNENYELNKREQLQVIATL